ncbi:4-hydroxybenzoate polyprenyltransferase, mitochondrial-like isoform X1 [Artemia franciscana]
MLTTSYNVLFGKNRLFLNSVLPKLKFTLRCCSTNQTEPRKKTNLPEKIVSSFPVELQPYLKLMRADKPVGTWLLFWPCGWSLALATPGSNIPDLGLLSLFLVGAFVMRGAGCTINDIWDKDFDRKVVRTKDRPIASGEISRFHALVFLAGQLGIGLSILLQFNWNSILIGASSLGFVALYPAMKRITYWPQLVLGLTLNWGALMGWSALHGTTDWYSVLPLYAAGVCWTMIYDTIYAHQDKYDDAVVGVKSTALRFGADTKKWLSVFGVGMITNLFIAGHMSSQSWPFYASVMLTAIHIGRQVSSVKLDDSNDCAEKFQSNKYVGLLLFLGITAGSFLK